MSTEIDTEAPRKRRLSTAEVSREYAEDVQKNYRKENARSGRKEGE